MNFNNIFHKAFENVSPITDDEIYRNVIERTENMENKKKTSVKKPLVIGIVSATVLAFGITGYASGWNYREVFDRVFGEKAENIEENILEEGTVIENKIEEFDIRLSGAASDKYSSVIILDIASRDGTRLYDPILGKDIFNEKYNIFLSTYSPDFNYCGLSWSQDYIEYDENSIRISLTTGTNYDMTGEKIYIKITERKNPEKKWVTSVDINTE
ncbi:MAG: hypothetical protein IJZ65_06670, partial [Ruminiclostridium sp.]|nr:hypothetical protein [Ruminiclostridium sp.]